MRITTDDGSALTLYAILRLYQRTLHVAGGRSLTREPWSGMGNPLPLNCTQVQIRLELDDFGMVFAVPGLARR
jgi:hypothetical protein